jgi:hypothetical protein
MPMTDGPSAGAMRAAKLIARSDKLRPLVFGGILRETAAESWAEIIDEQTVLKELLEALEMLVADNQRRAMHEGVTVNWAAIHLAQAAILKAKG